MHRASRTPRPFPADLIPGISPELQSGCFRRCSSVARTGQRLNMALINLRNLGVTLGAPLFSSLNVSIGAGDRLSVIAANGRGKSTLLRVLAGGFEAGAGEITRARG